MLAAFKKKPSDLAGQFVKTAANCGDSSAQPNFLTKDDSKQGIWWLVLDERRGRLTGRSQLQASMHSPLPCGGSLTSLRFCRGYRVIEIAQSSPGPGSFAVLDGQGILHPGSRNQVRHSRPNSPPVCIATTPRVSASRCSSLMLQGTEKAAERCLVGSARASRLSSRVRSLSLHWQARPDPRRVTQVRACQ